LNKLCKSISYWF